MIELHEDRIVGQLRDRGRLVFWGVVSLYLRGILSYIQCSSEVLFGGSVFFTYIVINVVHNDSYRFWFVFLKHSFTGISLLVTSEWTGLEGVFHTLLGPQRVYMDDKALGLSDDNRRPLHSIFELELELEQTRAVQ